MQPDLEYLRRHYASLSDEALLEIDRAELVEAARSLYDQELVERKLVTKRSTVRAPVDDPEAYVPPEGEELPEWAEDAQEVFSQVTDVTAATASEAADARIALSAAGIPCYIESEEIEPDPVPPKATLLWRVMVPGDRNLEATSIIQRDLHNQTFAENWQHHLEELSDDELREMNPQVTFCGLFDRIERVQRAYDEELKRRRLR
jgi:hypothetical protein